MTVVYVDVLLLVNLLVNYFLLLGTCFFTKEAQNRIRFFIAAAVGALFSFTVLLPIISALTSFARLLFMLTSVELRCI